MKPFKYIKPVISIIILVFIDQITKQQAVKHLKFQNSYMLIDHVISLIYHENAGAAFGLLQGGRWFFVAFTVIFAAAVCYYYTNIGDGKINSCIKACLVVVLAGALGNFTDRFLNGYVVDFINFEFIDFPVFNMADIYVVTGVIFLAVLIIFFVKDENIFRMKTDNKNYE